MFIKNVLAFDDTTMFSPPSFQEFSTGNPVSENKHVSINSYTYTNKNIKKIINTSKSSDINNTIKNLIGEDIFFLNKTGFCMIKNINSCFYVNSSLLSEFNNPIFPEAIIKINNEIRYDLLINKRFNKIKSETQISYGGRKYINKKYQIDDVLTKNLTLNFPNKYKEFMEIDQTIKYSYYFLKFKSIPLFGYFPINYTEIKVGAISKKRKFLLGELSVYANSNLNDYVIGSNLDFKFINFDLIIKNSFFNAIIATLDLNFLKISAYYQEDYYKSKFLPKKEMIGTYFILSF